MKANEYGEVTGGGSMQEPSGEIKYVDIGILLETKQKDKEKAIKASIEFLEPKGAPKGSKKRMEDSGEKSHSENSKVSVFT